MGVGEKCFCASLRLVLVVITLTSITVVAQTGVDYSLINESAGGDSKRSDFALLQEDEKKIPSERTQIVSSNFSFVIFARSW